MLASPDGEEEVVDRVRDILGLVGVGCDGAVDDAFKSRDCDLGHDDDRDDKRERVHELHVHLARWAGKGRKGRDERGMREG